MKTWAVSMEKDHFLLREKENGRAVAHSNAGSESTGRRVACFCWLRAERFSVELH